MKKLFALLLAVVMVVGLFAACVQDPKPTEPQKPTETQPQGTDGTTEGTEPTEPAFEYPVKNPVSFEYSTWQSTWEAHFESMGDLPRMKAWAEATGVAPKFVMTKTDEDFNLMLAGGEKTMVDVFQKTDAQLPGGPQGCIDEGIIIPLNDLIDKYMPNLKALLEKYPELDAAVKTADGDYYVIPGLNAEVPRNPATQGPFISKHMMDEYNITTVPETIDEWYTMLKTFKDKGVEAPFGSNMGTLFNSGPFIGAYLPRPNADGVVTDGRAGKLSFAYTSDAYKEYLKTLKKWYSEGLFGNDFFSIVAKDINANITSDKSIASFGYIGSGIQTLTDTGKKTNPDFEFVAPKYPSVEKGGMTNGYVNYPVMYPGWGAYITSACEEEKYESVCRWFDYAYSEEGIILNNFGLEGVTYEMKDGEPIYLDSFLNPKPAEGWSAGQYKDQYYQSGNGIVYMADGDAYPQTLVKESASNALDLWFNQNATDKWQERTIPNLPFSSEDNETKAGITAELINYCKTEAANFVKGDKDLDKDWDAYVKACKGFGSDTLVGLYQYYYDAYFEKF